MPSGITSPIYNNEKGFTFEKFMLLCARSFGACIMQKDEDMSQPPKLQRPSDYHKVSLQKAKNKLAKLKKMKDSAFDKLLKKQIKATKNLHIEDLVERGKLRGRYQEILEEVELWNPPTKDHEGLKKFAIEQLKNSIKFDCEGSDYYNKLLSSLLQHTAASYKQQLIAKAKRDVEYHLEEWLKEQKHTKERNDWIVALFESLKQNK